MAENQATIVLLDGSSYESPLDNLDNVRRVMAGKIKNIILPGEEETDEDADNAPVIRKGGRPKKQTN